MSGWPPVDWASRFLDDSEAHCSRECLLVDLVRALRIIGAMTPETRDLWTQFSVTCDPLTQPSRAASMVRSFLDAVIAQLPSEGMAEPPRYHVDDDEARIRASRRAWADGVLEAVLGMPMSQFAAHGGRSAPVPSVGGTVASLGTRDGTEETEGTLTHPADEVVHPVPESVLAPTVPMWLFLMTARLKLLKKLQVLHLLNQMVRLSGVKLRLSRGSSRQVVFP